MSTVCDKFKGPFHFVLRDMNSRDYEAEMMPFHDLLSKSRPSTAIVVQTAATTRPTVTATSLDQGNESVCNDCIRTAWSPRAKRMSGEMRDHPLLLGRCCIRAAVMLPVIRMQNGKTATTSIGIVTHLYLQGTQHACDVLLLLADEEDVFQHDGPSFVAGVQN